MITKKRKREIALENLSKIKRTRGPNKVNKLKQEIENKLRSELYDKLDKYWNKIMKTFIDRAIDKKHKDGTITKADIRATIKAVEHAVGTPLQRIRDDNKSESITSIEEQMRALADPKKSYIKQVEAKVNKIPLKE